MSRALDDLDSSFRAVVFELLARCVEARLQVIVIDTLRTPEEQEENIRNGVSWTKNSKHLPQPPHGKSKAIDIAPVSVLSLKNWAPGHREWHVLGLIGKSLGLRWGGDWKVKDMGHFEAKS